MPKRWSRREFTRNAALSALFSPFVSLVTGDGAARAATGRAKYLCLFVTTGTHIDSWTPRGSTENSIRFSSMNAPLAAIKENLIIIEKLSGQGTSNDHNQPGGLTGRGQGPYASVDQFVADRIRAGGTSTAIPSLILGGVPGANGGAQQQRLFFAPGEHQTLLPNPDPTSAYNVIFGGAQPPDSTTPPSDRLRLQMSQLDCIRDELRQLSQALGPSERAKLELHEQSIRELERRLSGEGVVTPTGNCGVAAPTPTGRHVADSVIQLDLAINAMACDLTRVAAVQFGWHHDNQVELPEADISGDWHQFQHAEAFTNRANLHKLEAWLSEQFVAAAEKLKSLPAPDGNGTLFDQTLLVWARDMGESSDGHGDDDMRFVLTGATDYLRTSPDGRYIDGGGRAHQRVLLNACEAMGVMDFSGFGSDGQSSEDRTPLSEVCS